MPLNPNGKVGKEWLKVRRAWLKANPPNHQGYYVCAICGRWVHESEVEVDHILARTRRPDLRFDHTNLQPAHSRCNTKKGST
jgi:5-methylcytosine-specific restriction endonuclease McrA